MKDRVVFLVSAQMQTGKDTFADSLCRWTRCIKVPFANPVKEVAVSMLGMPPEIAYGGEAARRAWKRYGKDAREWLQWIGTELGRQMIDPDIWIHRWAERTQGFSGAGFVISDARFKNEILDLGDMLWLATSLERIGVQSQVAYHLVRIRLKRPAVQGVDGHVSETEQLVLPDDLFDEVVVNDQAIGTLDHHAQRIARKYLDDRTWMKDPSRNVSNAKAWTNVQDLP